MLEFTIIALLLVLSPGPNGVLIFKTCLNAGSKHSLVNILGLVTATFLHGAFSIFGLSAVIKNTPSLFFAIKILGALYLCYIGVKTIWNSIRNKKSASKNANLNDIKTTNPRLFRSYLEGFLTQILNPKVSLFYLAAFPLFVDFNLENYIFTSFILVAIHASLIFTWFVLFTILFERLKLLIDGSGLMAKYLQVFTGLVLVYFGIFILKQV